MIPLPNLSLTGGAGGDAKTGDQTGGQNPWSVAIGAVQFGGRGNEAGAATSSASAKSMPSWVWIAGAALLGAGVLWFALRKK